MAKKSKTSKKAATPNLEEQIAEWANQRPPCQRRLLETLCKGEPIDDALISSIADDLLSGKEPTVSPLARDDIPGGQSKGSPVYLDAIVETRNVNALIHDQELGFGSPKGLTVIYGDNASGKSGYARPIKATVGARHLSPVLRDVFKDEGSDLQEATLKYSAGTSKETKWPQDPPPELGQIQFYDEACGDEYIGGESELTYRPSALVLLDRLTASSDRVRDALDKRLDENAASKEALPAVPETSSAAEFLSGLGATTTEEQLTKATTVPEDAEQKVAELLQEEKRLRASDPNKEKKRLEAQAKSLALLKAHVEKVDACLGQNQLKSLAKLRRTASEQRKTAAMASSKTFNEEPLAGVGSESWRALWHAAKKFSLEEAYHEHEFPHTGDQARCVLCQQTLPEDAADRLKRFQAFMEQETEKLAAESERQVELATTEIRQFDPMPGAVVEYLSELQAGHQDVVADVRAWLETARDQKRDVLDALEKRGDLPAQGLPSPPTEKLETAAGQSEQAASKIDDKNFQEQLERIVKEREELEGRISLNKGQPTIKKELGRLKQRAAIEKAKKQTETMGITKKATDLTRTHVTTFVRDRFTRETDRLRLEKVTLADAGGHKGQLRHRPELLGASDTSSVTEVLSEGEQTALGLAGYFTEASLDESKSGLVLDDPVTSLDHIRRGNVASRLGELAADRQVIVFTHDLAFVAELRKAADQSGADFTERTIERSGDNRPGVCVDGHPWKAKDAKARFHELEKQLAEIKKSRSSWDQERYEKESADWAGKLSETWERIIHVEVVNEVVDRGSFEVRQKKFRLFARITDSDDKQFQESYSRCSQWARRHDKAEEVNYVAPDVSDLEKELELVKDWYERVRKYVK